MHSSIVDAIIPRASFYTLVTRESRNERVTVLQAERLHFRWFPLSPSLLRSGRRWMFTTSGSGRARGYELHSVVQLVQHLAFRGATRRDAQGASGILYSRFLVIRYLETISPLVLRAFTRYRLAFGRLSARSRAVISPLVTQLQHL